MPWSRSREEQHSTLICETSVPFSVDTRLIVALNLLETLWNVWNRNESRIYWFKSNIWGSKKQTPRKSCEDFSTISRRCEKDLCNSPRSIVFPFEIYAHPYHILIAHLNVHFFSFHTFSLLQFTAETGSNAIVSQMIPRTGSLPYSQSPHTYDAIFLPPVANSSHLGDLHYEKSKGWQRCLVVQIRLDGLRRLGNFIIDVMTTAVIKVQLSRASDP